MVAGFQPPEGDPGVVSGALGSWGTMHGDLTRQAGTLRSGFSTALDTWRATRSEGFRAAGESITTAVRAGAGVLDGAISELDGYVVVLRRGREDIADLERLARQREQSLAGEIADLEPDDTEGEREARSGAAAYVDDLRQQAEMIRTEVRRFAGTTAAGLDVATNALVPGGADLSPADLVARVDQASGVEDARRAMANDTLTESDAWEALEAAGGAGGNVLEAFVEKWGGFRPPTDGDPTSQALYALGRLGFAGGSTASWMTTVRHGMFRPIDRAGRIMSPRNMTFWERLRAGAGRFPTGRGLTTWERVRGFDRKGNWKPKGWRGAPHSRWSTAGKWMGRAGSGITAATSGWNEWQDSAAYPTDERLGRSVTKGASTAAGAWAGAQGGGMVGGAIGTAIFPGVGTVIGAGVGALIGGFAGSQAGAWVGDRIKDIGGEVGGAIGDGLEAAGEVAGDVGDALTFWD